MIFHEHKCPECFRYTECGNRDCKTEEHSTHRPQGEERICPQCEMFPLVDLRSITRRPDKHLTIVRIFHDRSLHRSKKWIVMGQARLVKRQGSGIRPWTLDAYLENATDFEHDSAYAISLGLLAVEFDSIYYGRTEINAVIDPHDIDSFCVPPPGYNPMELPDAVPCTDKRCIEADGPHIIVPENYYSPPVNRELFPAARGRFVKITFGVPSDEI